mgnify:CR=1 FL=1
MSKKPTPSKKQAVSSTRSRHATWVRKSRTKLENKVVLDQCESCGAKKRRHYACQECGMFKGRQVFEVKSKSSAQPLQEIEA